MAFSKQDHDMLNSIHTVLFGENGDPGLCRKFEDFCKKVDHNKRQILILWMSLAFIVALGGGGGYALIRDILSGVVAASAGG